MKYPPSSLPGSSIPWIFISEQGMVIHLSWLQLIFNQSMIVVMRVISRQGWRNCYHYHSLSHRIFQKGGPRTIILFITYKNSSVHLITVRVLVVLGNAGASPYFLLTSHFRCCVKLLETRSQRMLPTVSLCPTVLQYLTRLDAALRRSWDFYPNTNDCIGNVAPTAAPVFLSVMRPQGCLKLQVSCLRVSLSKLAKLCRNMSSHTQMGRLAARLETMVLVINSYVVVYVLLNRQ